jgi:hypothetical protein
MLNHTDVVWPGLDNPGNYLRYFSSYSPAMKLHLIVHPTFSFQSFCAQCSRGHKEVMRDAAGTLLYRQRQGGCARSLKLNIDTTTRP